MSALAELAPGWRNVRIADLATTFDGPHATPKSLKTARSGPVFLGISSLTDGRIDLAASGFLSEEDFARWTRRVTPEPGDVVFSYETRLGEAAMIPEGLRCALGRRLALMRPRREIVDPRFLLYAFLGPGFQETIRQNTIAGSTVDRILLRDFPAFPMLLPNLEEQRGIAATLGALDDRIESNRRQVALALELLDGLAAVLAQTVTDETTLAAIGDASRDAFDPRPLADELFDHFSIPAFDARKLPERVPGRTVVSNKLTLREPSVLVSRLNPRTNRTWFAVPEPGVVAGCSTEFLVLTPRDGVSLGALWLAVRDELFRDSLAQRASGTSGSHQRVRPGDVLATLVPDVRTFSRERTGQADALLALVQQRRVESARVEAVRNALLPELLSGRIRVPEATQAVEPTRI